jgi:hypothetical protein
MAAVRILAAKSASGRGGGADARRASRDPVPLSDYFGTPVRGATANDLNPSMSFFCPRRFYGSRVQSGGLQGGRDAVRSYGVTEGAPNPEISTKCLPRQLWNSLPRAAAHGAAARRPEPIGDLNQPLTSPSGKAAVPRASRPDLRTATRPAAERPTRGTDSP